MSSHNGRIRALLCLSPLILLLLFYLSPPIAAFPTAHTRRGMSTDLAEKLFDKATDEARQIFNAQYMPPSASTEFVEKLERQQQRMNKKLRKQIDQVILREQVEVPKQNHRRVQDPLGKSYSV
ncbi:putative membrane protein [Pseudozyma hubeiensis]|nr:putative membrane protein [Pseudozyma hubeiensis]